MKKCFQAKGVCTITAHTPLSATLVWQLSHYLFRETCFMNSYPIELRFDFEKIKIPKCRCRRFSPTARGRSVPCGAFLPSPGVLRRGRDIHEPTRSSCYENVGENTDDWRTPQDI